MINGGPSFRFECLGSGGPVEVLFDMDACKDPPSRSPARYGDCSGYDVTDGWPSRPHELAPVSITCTPADAGIDAGMTDAGMPDAGMPDAGMPDAGPVEGGMVEPPPSDPVGDFLDSISTAIASFTSAAFDLVNWSAWATPIDSAEADRLFRSLYECGTVEAGQRVVCPAGVMPMPAGELVTVTSTFAAAVPQSDPGHSYIYSAVFDSDGRASNDWVARSPFDWDLFQGADRWYQLAWDHRRAEWSVTVTQVDDSQRTSTVPSTARAVIDGDTVTWFISASEFSPSRPGYRVTSFGHDGSFSPTDRGADVNGANPTEPLTTVTR